MSCKIFLIDFAVYLFLVYSDNEKHSYPYSCSYLPTQMSHQIDPSAAHTGVTWYLPGVQKALQKDSSQVQKLGVIMRKKSFGASLTSSYTPCLDGNHKIWCVHSYMVPCHLWRRSPMWTPRKNFRSITHDWLEDSNPFVGCQLVETRVANWNQKTK